MARFQVRLHTRLTFRHTKPIIRPSHQLETQRRHKQHTLPASSYPSRGAQYPILSAAGITDE